MSLRVSALERGWSGRDDPALAGLRDISAGAGSPGMFYATSRPGGVGVVALRLEGAGVARFDAAPLPGQPVAGVEARVIPLAIDGQAGALVTGRGGSGAWAYRVAADGRLSAEGGAAGTAPLPRDLARLHAVENGGHVHVYGTRQGQAEILRWRFAADGRLDQMTSHAAGTVPGPSGLTALDHVALGSSRFLIAAGDGRDALMTYALAPGGRPRPADRLAVADGPGLADPSALATVSIAGGDYVVLAASGSSSLSVFALDAEGKLALADHVIDTRHSRFHRVTMLEAVEIDGAVYLAAAGADQGVSLFQMLPGGRLVHLGAVADDLHSGLTGVTDLAIAHAGGRLELLAVSEKEAGVTRLSVPAGPAGQLLAAPSEADALLRGGGGDDVLSGAGGDDRLFGGAGDDILQDGPGEDRMTGGAGADFFVLEADGAIDRILGFDPAQDRLDLSAWPFLRSWAQITVTELANGAVLKFGTEKLRLTGPGGQRLDAEALQGALLEGPDRLLPAWIEGAVLESGEAGGEEDGAGAALLLRGGAGADALRAGPGDDRLYGGGGRDSLFGAAGADMLQGGAGADYLNGGPGSDSYFVDDPGDRVIESGRWEGHDKIHAAVDYWMRGVHAETLALLEAGGPIRGIGNGLRNEIIGNAHANILDGNRNVDRLVGGRGDDVYHLRSPGDAAIELPGEGIDTIKGYGSQAMGPNIEKLHLQTMRDPEGRPVQGVNGVGNALGNEIVGNPFDNVLIGREGRDVLRGHHGADVFVFDRPPGRDNVDRILDFVPGLDEIRIQARRFGMAADPWEPGSFRIGSRAADRDDRLLYDPATGALRIDPDGTGPRPAPVAFLLSGAPDLQPSDVVLV